MDQRYRDRQYNLYAAKNKTSRYYEAILRRTLTINFCSFTHLVKRIQILSYPFWLMCPLHLAGWYHWYRIGRICGKTWLNQYNLYTCIYRKYVLLLEFDYLQLFLWPVLLCFNSFCNLCNSLWIDVRLGLFWLSKSRQLAANWW